MPNFSDFLKRMAKVNKALATGPKGGYHPGLELPDVREFKKSGVASDRLKKMFGETIPENVEPNATKIIPEQSIPKELLDQKNEAFENYLRDNPEIAEKVKGLTTGNSEKEVSDRIKKALAGGTAGLALGSAALGSNNAEASVPKDDQSNKFLKNPYENLGPEWKKSLMYKDIPEQYRQEESLESPSIDPIDVIGFGAPGGARGIAKTAGQFGAQDMAIEALKKIKEKVSPKEEE